MKELSIEEKAKAYDEAKARMSKACNSNRCTIGFMNEIFPELKENEDERVRKIIIEYMKTGTYNKDYIRYADRYSYEIWRKLMDNFKNIKDYHIGCNEVSDIVLNAIIDTFNWLEKGGDKNKVSKHVEAINEEKVDDANKVEPKDYNSIDPHFGKPADKVEPKFKVKKGEWYVCTDTFVSRGKIIAIKGQTYQSKQEDNTITCEDNCLFIDRHDGKASDYFRPWTIQDAKEGDVLFHSDSASNGIFIFKEIIDKGFTKEVICYCDYDSEDHFCLGEHHTCCWADAKILHPATKEQRDTLEKAMADAGWEFDFEKKELKKIKLKSDDETEHLIPQKGVYYTCIKDYYSSDNTHLYVKGNIYKSSFNGYIDDESHFGLSWTNSCTEKYFEPTKDEDWVVCEYDNVIGKPLQYKEFKKKVNQKFIENLKAQSLTPKLRLWNLQDAKAGDVLAISWWEDNNFWEKIIIFKKYHNKGVKGLYYMPCVEGYGNTFKNGKLVFNEKVLYYSKTWTCNLHPATKEQRDTLMKAMADAGYTFNFEKKELKKLGQSEVTKTSDQEEIAEIPFGAKDSELQEATYFIPKGFYAEIDDDKVVIKKGEKPATWSEEDELSCFESALFTAFSDAWQSYLLGEEVNVKRWAKEQSKELLEAAKEELKGHNSAWSEEDEKRIFRIKLSLQKDMMAHKHSGCDIADLQNCEDWLMNLYESHRVQPQPKQEWSERDKEEFQIAIDTLVEAGQHDPAHWLKSLKQRIGG